MARRRGVFIVMFAGLPATVQRAAFIGFTGTPVESGDQNGPAVFGAIRQIVSRAKSADKFLAAVKRSASTPHLRLHPISARRVRSGRKNLRCLRWKKARIAIK